MRLFQNSHSFFVCLSKFFLLQLFDILKQTGFSKSRKGPPFTILKPLRFLSLRYSANFRCSRLVVFTELHLLCNSAYEKVPNKQGNHKGQRGKRGKNGKILVKRQKRQVPLLLRAKYCVWVQITFKPCISMRSVVHANLILRNVNARTRQSSRTLNTLASLPSARQCDYVYNAKIASSTAEKIATFAQQYPDEFQNKNNSLFCKLCKVSFQFETEL